MRVGQKLKGQGFDLESFKAFSVEVQFSFLDSFSFSFFLAGNGLSSPTSTSTYGFLANVEAASYFLFFIIIIIVFFYFCIFSCFIVVHFSSSFL
jgi:hypothetical protein